MAFHHRKFLNEFSPGPGEDGCFCQLNCDTPRNPENHTCKKICYYPNCKLPPHPFPPPSPEPPVPPLQSPPDKHPGLPVFLNVFLPILATAFFFFICYAIYKFYSYWHGSRRRQSRRAQPEEDAGPNDFVEEDYGPVVDHPIWYIRTVGLQPSVISAITIVKYKRGDGLVEGTDCSVCLNEFQEDETLRLLPKCNHAFHIPCIDTWLRSHTNCPMCRAGIVINNTTPLPAQELTVQSSGLVEEARVGVSGNGREVRREAETEASELRIGIEVQAESSGQIEPKIDESGFDGIQPMRRSVSLDSLSVSMISAAVANAFPGQPDSNSDKQLVKQKESTGRIAAKNVAIDQCTSRLAESPSIERSMQAGSSSVKRSLSCSAKVFLSRHTGRSRNSVNPQ